MSLTFREFLALVKIADPDRGCIAFDLTWQHLIDLAEEWESGQSQIILKARQVGVSWLLAAYALWLCLSRDSATVLELSQGQDEAGDLLRKSHYIYDNLPEQYRLPLTTDNTFFLAWTNNSRILALPATQRGGRSYSATLVIVDEAAFHPYAAQNYAAYRPTLDAGQLLMVSTAHHVTGEFFKNMYWAAKAGETRYTARFLGWFSRPDRDDAWLDAQRGDFKGLPAEFEEEYPATDSAAFVALTGLVYPMFNPSLHIRAEPCRWEDCKRRYAGVDWGGGDPTAVVLLGVTASDQVHQYGEFYRRGMVDVATIADWLWEWHRRARIATIACDPSEPVAIATLRVATTTASRSPVIAADNARGEGLGNVAYLLSSGRLTIDPSCVNSIREFDAYRWRDRVDPNSKDRYATGTPVDHHADCLVPGTLITTARGQVRIEAVVVGDMVLTRDGYRPVVAAWLSSPAIPTYRVTLSDGRSLTGTAEHPVWVDGRGFTHIDALRYGDIIASCNHSTATTTARLVGRGTGTRRGGVAVAPCIGMYGSSSMAPSQRDTLSITATITQTTTKSPISLRFLRLSTDHITGISMGAFRLRQSPQLRSGIGHQSDASGIGNMGVVHTRHGNWCSTCASSAGSSSNRSPEAPSASAIPIARRAPYVLAVEPTGLAEPVYDLTVEGKPEFYANGILVHNSMDARRYAVQEIMRNEVIYQRQPVKITVTHKRDEW